MPSVLKQRLPASLASFYRLVLRLLPKLKKAATVIGLLSLLIHLRWHRKWYRGLIQTVVGLVRCRIRHIQNVLLKAYHRVEFVASDGETCVVLWPHWCLFRSPHRHGSDVDQRVIFSDSDETLLRYRRQKTTVPTHAGMVSSMAVDKHDRKEHRRRPHVWIGLPGGMRPQEENMDLLYAKAAFEGSMYCVFLNPGISSQMKNRLTPSPVDVSYLLQYIEFLNAHGFAVSTIGFSIGGMQSMRLAGAVRGKVDLSFAGHKSKFAGIKKTNHTPGMNGLGMAIEDGSLASGTNSEDCSMSSDSEEEDEVVHSSEENQKTHPVGIAGECTTDGNGRDEGKPRYMVVSCVSIHSPDRIRDIFEHLQQNWLWRFDIFFARHLYNIHVANGSQSMLINRGMDEASPYYPKGWFPWLNGWKYLKSITETFLNQDWHTFEDAEFDSRSFLRLPEMSDNEGSEKGSSEMCVIDLKQPNVSAHPTEDPLLSSSPLIRATDRRQAWKQSEIQRKKAAKHGIEKKENVMFQFPKVCRLFSKNDPIVPLKCIDRDCFKEIDKVVITEGGHCSALSCPLIAEELSLWNKQCLKYLL